MSRLEDNFPELRWMERVAQCFDVGQEEPAWRQWTEFTPQQRLRYLELQRRISFGDDAVTGRISRIAQFVESGEH